MKVLVINQSSIRTPRKFIEQWCRNVEKQLLKRKVLSKTQQKLELTVVFLDTAEARKTNKQFRQKDYATDVLSFDPLEPGTLGELVLCPQVLRRQAKEHKLSYQQELGYMILHGILHLLGYDHEISEKEAQRMFALQDEIFDSLLK